MLLLAGCSSLEGTGDKGYISGDGQVSQIKPGNRGEPIELAGDGLDGEEVDLADRRGKPTVLVVWASWCSPCRAEADDVADAAEELEGTAHFVGINTRDDESRAVAFVRSKRVPYPSIVDQDGEAMLAFPGTLTPRTIPAFVVLDGQGRIAASIIGQLPSKLTLVQLAEEVAAEAADGPASGSADG